MLFYLKLALKNLGRHRKRTIITASAIAFGLMTFLFFDSMLQGADSESMRNLIWYETGGMRIYSPEGAAKFQMPSLSRTLDRSAEIQKALYDWGLQSTRRITLQGELVLSDPRFAVEGSTVVRVLAIDTVTDSLVFPQKDLRMQGRWFAPDEAGAVIGVWLAQDLGIKPGDALSVSCRTREGSYQVLDLTVTGIVDSPNPNMNRSSLYIPLAFADAQLGMDGAVTEIVLPAAVTDDAVALADHLQKRLDQAGFTAKVLTWKDLAADFLAISVTKQKGSSSMLFLVFIIAAVGISNTLLMAFYERKAEIGMLRALGMDDRTLFWTFIAEAAGIGLIGSILGLILGGLAVAYMVYLGFDFSFVTRSMDIGYRISGMFYGVWVPKSFVGAFIFGVILSGVIAIFPTRRALKLPITESLRTE